jgi:hypothetical protein
MDDMARRRVRNALDSSGQSQVQAVKELRDAEQLHQFALNYNVNDGFSPLQAIIEHPACDKGTALYIYWLFFDEHTEIPSTKVARSPEFDAPGLVAAIERRVQSESFATAEIFFNPAAEFSKVQLYKLHKQGRDAFLQAIGRRILEREWL